MRILFVLANDIYFYTIDPVVRELCRRGHKVFIATGRREKRNFSDDALRNAQADFPNLSVMPLLRRRFLRRAARNLREVLNYAHVLNNESKRLWDIDLWGRFFPNWLWNIVKMPLVKAKLKEQAFQKRLRNLEQKIPINKKIKDELSQIAPDVVLTLPLINPDSLETEYLRAAKVLGIPTIYAMASWDNTSTKGTFHGLPDYSLVWNKPLANELIQFHGFAQDRIYMTGAPRFSYLLEGFNEGFVLPRNTFFEQTELSVDKPYILYVGSTFLVNANRKKELDESVIIIEIAHSLMNDPRTKDVNILVRPHPLNTQYVSRLLKEELPNVFVYPKHPEMPDSIDRIKRYNSSIYYSAAVMGINTTAFLEVAALDKPCIALYFDQFVETQKLPHFHHLEDGGFLEAAYGAIDAVEVIGKIIRGVDEFAIKRREFVNNFLKPTNSNEPSYKYYADTIEMLAFKK